MAPLPTELRNLLGRTIVAARRNAEAGAHKALESLAVERHEPYGSMSPEERKLRNRLRARGRQLGDVRDKQLGSQSINRLTHEVAYEHWHRMLFARFLAENNLLIHPEHGIAVSLDEIEELAREVDENPHTMAARFAQSSLPQIFRSGDPVLDVTLAPETRQALDKLLDSLPAEVFTADDSLGWTYQYWQTEKKDEINESGNKIGADELPAVTQLFTEHYMVLFLYHNTIGAWHAGKVLTENPSLAETAQSEEELRQAMSLLSQDGYDFEYLRFVREAKKGDEVGTPTGPWHPAAGTYEGWPKFAQELKVLDPCCGSGHFLTEGFKLLVRLRMEEEGLNLDDAIHGTLAHNLNGLELDPRCTQIAAFNLALAAWKLAGKPIELPPLNIACTGQTVGSTKVEWIELAGDSELLRTGMEQLYNMFEQAPELGSLIDPKVIKSELFEADFSELQPLLKQALAGESEDFEDTERAVAAQGMAHAAELLSNDYSLVMTNPPFLGLEKQGDVLEEYVKANHTEAKRELALCLLDRSKKLLTSMGTSAFVLPSEWTFVRSHRGFRRYLLNTTSINSISRLGSNAFNVSIRVSPLLLISSSKTNDLENKAVCLDVSSTPLPEKISRLITEPCSTISQDDWEVATDWRLLTTPMTMRAEGLCEIGLIADSRNGLSAGDGVRFELNFWEISKFGETWDLLQSSTATTQHFGGRERIVRWEKESGKMAELAKSVKHLNHSAQNWRRGKPLWGKLGIIVNQIGAKTTIFDGNKYDGSCFAIVPHESTDAQAIIAYALSGQLKASLKQINPTWNLKSPKTLLQLPVDLAAWNRKSKEMFPSGLPEPKSDDPTQWLFHGHPAMTEPANVLQVATVRLLGYHWPPELAPDIRLADKARKWVIRCDELKNFTDPDGIVCLSATRGERSASDRLRELLSTAFGANWSTAKERELLAVTGTSRSLDAWLRDNFFEEHCKLFQNRPFIWHIWDGNKDGFHCFVNAHKLTGPDGESRRTLQAITYSYLGDWIDRQKADLADGKEGADARLAAAQDLYGQLEKILEGEPPYDLFIRWKPLHEQAIGWEPDINDGVRLNIRPFMNAELRKGGKKGAGVLRWKPNISWKKDRGKEPESLRPKADFPWFWNCNGNGSETDRTNFTGGPEFEGNRWNDLHYSNALKVAASERREGKSKA